MRCLSTCHYCRNTCVYQDGHSGHHRCHLHVMTVTPPKKDSKPDKPHKLRWSLLPLQLVEPAARAMQNGVDKGYEPNSWQRGPKEKAVPKYNDALMRHLAAYQGGEGRDPDSGLHPLDHVMACVVILRWWADQ
jgi:hypothetical protein